MGAGVYAPISILVNFVGEVNDAVLAAWDDEVSNLCAVERVINVPSDVQLVARVRAVQAQLCRVGHARRCGGAQGAGGTSNFSSGVMVDAAVARAAANVVSKQ